MKLSAPTQMVWIIALILGIVGVIATLTPIPVVSGFAFWLVVIGWLLLVVATFVKGL